MRIFLVKQCRYEDWDMTLFIEGTKSCFDLKTHTVVLSILEANKIWGLTYNTEFTNYVKYQHMNYITFQILK